MFLLLNRRVLKDRQASREFQGTLESKERRLLQLHLVEITLCVIDPNDPSWVLCVQGEMGEGHPGPRGPPGPPGPPGPGSRSVSSLPGLKL